VSNVYYVAKPSFLFVGRTNLKQNPFYTFIVYKKQDEKFHAIPGYHQFSVTKHNNMSEETLLIYGS